jgi:hypothetical protein
MHPTIRAFRFKGTADGVWLSSPRGVVRAEIDKGGSRRGDLSLFIGAVVTSVIVVLLVYATRRIIERGRLSLEPSFPR